MYILIIIFISKNFHLNFEMTMSPYPNPPLTPKVGNMVNTPNNDMLRA